MVLADHMADLMAQHAGQFCLILQLPVEPLGQENVAARRREGVDVVAFDHAEMPGQIGPLALQGDPAADPVDIALQAVVAHQGCGAEQVAGDLLADAQFFFRRGLAGEQRLEQQGGRFILRRGGGHRGGGRHRLNRRGRLRGSGRLHLLLDQAFEKLVEIARLGDADAAKRDDYPGEAAFHGSLLIEVARLSDLGR